MTATEDLSEREAAAGDSPSLPSKGQFSLLRNGPLLAMGVGHGAVDLCANILPIFYPLLLVTLNLSYASVAALTTVQFAASSLSQPFFGWFADRFGSRIVAPASVLAAAAAIGLVGFTSNYYMLMLLVALLGLGVGAYHPQGAKAAAILGGRWRTTSLSIYMLFGNAGYSLGPLLAATVLVPAGLRSSSLLLIPGLMATLLLLGFTRRVDRVVMFGGTTVRKGGGASTSRAGIAAVGGVIVIRAWLAYGVIAFLPLLYAARGADATRTGEMLFLFIIMEGVGTAAGGWLADRIGRKPTMVVSFLLVAPLMHFFLAADGAAAAILALALGLMLGASVTITLVAVQEILPSRMGVASALAISLNQIMGGVGVAIQGVVADQYGLMVAMEILVGITLLAAVASAAVPAGEGARRE